MTARIPPMQALRALEAAARTGSLTRAAEALSVTHGAISHQIKALEAMVGVPLIERAGRGIRMTDDGERLATRVRAALADVAD
ncbi:MAG TPA: LysR family transcriptional regulator, partial [Casimicrobiaceae bacterium]|nr:LysR family transcriptional regulator [Casimicrobiaceae bacterium]